MCPILYGCGVTGIFNSRTRPRVNHVSRNQLAGDVLNLAAYLLRCQHNFRHLLAQFTPSGSLCCGRRWHFRKPALSTDQFKLKVISRREYYIYTLNVSCIMLVYYFVPFIVNNRYLLF